MYPLLASVIKLRHKPGGLLQAPNQFNRRVPVESNQGTFNLPRPIAKPILNGYAKGTMPDEYTGGVGRKASRI
jgi:hypothetical protein